MARKTHEDSVYRVSEHRLGKYSYAATHPYTLDADGRRRYRVLHWGTLTADRKFIPGKQYLQAKEEERSRLIFPVGWDLSALQSVSVAEPHRAGTPYDLSDAGKSYGAVWLLERIAEKLGIREDLERAFNGDTAQVDGLLSLVYFPLLTGTNFRRFLPWSQLSRIPSRALQTERDVDACIQSVTSDQLARFMALRRRRIHCSDFCAVDSVSRGSAGGFTADRKWGQKLERFHVQMQFDAAVYCMCSRLPVYFRSFPCAVEDSRGIGVLRAELSRAGFAAPVLVTDRGYDTLRSLGRYIAARVPMVMCVDAKQSFVGKRIQDLQFLGDKPVGMEADGQNARFFRQYLLDGWLDGCRLNLFFNPDRRAAELAQIDAEIAAQGRALEEIRRYALLLDDKRSARRNYYLYDLELDASGQEIRSFAPSGQAIARLRTAAGYYANVTSALDIGAVGAADMYSMKYDQEKFFRRFRPLINLPLCSGGPEEAAAGLSLIQFLMLLIDTRLREGHRDPVIRRMFRDVQAMTDEMHRVGCMPDAEGNCIPGPMSQDQLAVCQAFGLVKP